MGKYTLTETEYNDFNTYYSTNHPSVTVNFGYEADDGNYYVNTSYLTKLDLLGLSIEDACQSLYTQSKDEFFTQIKYSKDSELEVDTDGRQITKVAATKKGWRYLAHPIEIETSKLDSIYEQDWTLADRDMCTVKYYDTNNTELTAGTQIELDDNCVKTVINFKPSFDLDIIGGNIHQHTTPTENIRLWVTAGATELGALGVKEFVGGINLKYITPGSEINTDGRASARLYKDTEGVPYQTNQMQFIITHPVGVQHELLIVVEYFRA